MEPVGPVAVATGDGSHQAGGQNAGEQGREEPEDRLEDESTCGAAFDPTPGATLSIVPPEEWQPVDGEREEERGEVEEELCSVGGLGGVCSSQFTSQSDDVPEVEDSTSDQHHADTVGELDQEPNDCTVVWTPHVYLQPVLRGF